MDEKNKQNTEPEIVPWWTSCRFTLAIIGLFGTISIYMMRANMSVAIVCMTHDPEENNDTAPGGSVWNYTTPGEGVGSYPFQDGNSPPHITLMQDGEFDWSRQLRGWVMSSFYFGYFLTQIPGGWLANKFGAKIIIGGGVSMLTVLTLLTPVAARTSVYLLMVVQALKGFASGIYYPAFYQLFGRWTTPGDRTIIIAIFSAGSAAGSVISSILSGLLCDYGFDGGWPSIFYIFGIMGTVWCVVWYFMGFSSPQDHPRISDAELHYIQNALSSKADVKTLRVPWFELLRCVPLYALLVADICYSWCWYVALTSLPQYMKDVLKFDIKQNGFYNSLPYIANFTTAILVAVLANHLLMKQVISLTHARKLFQSIAMVPGAAMAIGVAFINEKQTGLAVALLTIWVGLMGCCRSGANPNMVEIAPRYSGIIMGIDNMMSTIPGIIAPPIIGVMTANGSTDEWQSVFFVCAGIYLVGWLVYAVFASAEEQEWAKVVPDREQQPQEYGSLDKPDHVELSENTPQRC